MKCRFLAGLAVLFLTTGCSISQQVNFICDQTDVEIYINEEYAGRNLVSCTLPRGTTYVTVSCHRDGEEVYSQRYYVKGKKSITYTLSVPNDYRYSDGGKTFR